MSYPPYASGILCTAITDHVVKYIATVSILSSESHHRNVSAMAHLNLFSLQYLQSGYRAVFIALGLYIPLTLHLPLTSSNNVVSSVHVHDAALPDVCDFVFVHDYLSSGGKSTNNHGPSIIRKLFLVYGHLLTRFSIRSLLGMSSPLCIGFSRNEGIVMSVLANCLACDYCFSTVLNTAVFNPPSPRLVNVAIYVFG